MNGSATLVRLLLAWGLLDELRLFVHPLVRGQGKRLFDGITDEVKLDLVESHAYPNGVISLSYGPGR